jgi:hypothetical protein
MELLDGIFSSPEKSPPKRSSGHKTGGTVTTSESMEIQESTSELQKRRVGAPPGLSSFERYAKGIFLMYRLDPGTHGNPQWSSFAP